MMRNLVTMGLSEIEKSVVKATYDDELPPKEKHCVFLVDCTAEYDLVQLFDRRLTMPKWNVVFKTLVVLHRLSIEGHERVMKDLAQNHHTFNLHSFFDASIGSQEHREFIAKYADYLAQKVYVYKLLGISVERKPPAESKEWARRLNGFELVKSLPAISQQFDKILLCAPYGHDTMHAQIPVVALSYLVKDAFRIYSTLTVLMLGVVDHYLELDAAQTKLILQVCLTFKAQNLRFKKWTQELARLGFAHDKLFPELVPIPDALFELLQDHINVKLGKTTASSVPPKKSAIAASASAAPAKKHKKPKKQVSDDEDDDEDEKDAMDSSDEEPVRQVTKKTAALAVSSKKSKPPVEEEEEDDDEESTDDEEERERKARKAAKKARKEEKRAKKEAKARKRAQAAQQEDDSTDEEEPVPAPKAKKKSHHAPAATVAAPSSRAAPGDIDLFAVLDAPVSQSRPAAATAASPAFAMPVSSNVFNPYPAASPAQPQYGYQQQQPAQYGAFAPQSHAPVAYGAPQAYGGGQMSSGLTPQPYDAFGGQPSLAGLQPLSSTHRSRGSFGGGDPGEDNTTAVGGIYDRRTPQAAQAAADPFGDLGPDLRSSGKQSRR